MLLKKKTQETIRSFYQLRKKGIYNSFPKYKSKNDKFILPYFSKSFTIKKINGTNFIQLSLGSYISNHYNDFKGNLDMILLNPDSEQNKYYINSKYLKLINNKKIAKSKNFIIGDKYIEKNNKHIILARYKYIKLPNKITPKNVKYIEINPVMNKYKINIVHEIKQKNHEPNNDAIKRVSIDFGVKNLMTIFSPNHRPIIISGSKILGMNNTYNYKISKNKSKQKKGTTNKIKNLFIKRSNEINDYFNKLVKWFLIKYNDVDEFIFGKNLGWKDGVNLGKTNNRNFYSIPYNKLVHKFQTKIEELGKKMIITEESYTSKCDALAFEPIEKRGYYLGERIKRGLFRSSVGLLLNADVNGAINIMRKYLLKNKSDLNNISLRGLCNPIKIKSDVIMK